MTGNQDKAVSQRVFNDAQSKDIDLAFESRPHDLILITNTFDEQIGGTAEWQLNERDREPLC